MTNTQNEPKAKKTRTVYTPAQQLERKAKEIELLKLKGWEKSKKDAVRALEALTAAVTSAPAPVPTRIDEMFGEGMIALKNVIEAIDGEQKSARQAPLFPKG